MSHKRRTSTSTKNKKTAAVADIEELDRFLFNGEQTATVTDSEPSTSADAPKALVVDAIRKKLLDWYDANHRVLPWRISPSSATHNTQDEKTDRGYAVWVSEIMLQQTRVQTVIDYYNRWMKRFPTIQALANATLEEVNAEWAGLGYYRRAKHLHECAKVVVSEREGKLPRTAVELESLPGIGKYTAGAIASLAYGQVAPLVDGNVIRVLSRIRAVDRDSKNTQVVKLFWSLASELVDPNRPGDFNQALMEHGALTCTPKNPNCSKCPISQHCSAFAAVQKQTIESVEVYPYKPAKAAPRAESVLVCMLVRKRRGDASDEKEFLLVKRPANGLLANMWEFPSLLLDDSHTNQSRKPSNDSNSDTDDDMRSEADEDQANQKTKRKSMPTPTPLTAEQLTTLARSHFLGSDRFVKLQQAETKTDIEIQSCGEVVHVFSHIRQTLFVHYVEVDGIVSESETVATTSTTTTTTTTGQKSRKQKTKSEDADTTTMRWVTESEMTQFGIPTITKKVFKQYVGHSTKPTAKKRFATTTVKTERTRNNKKQQLGILQFAKKQQQSTTEPEPTPEVTTPTRVSRKRRYTRTPPKPSESEDESAPETSDSSDDDSDWQEETNREKKRQRIQRSK